MVLLKSRIPWRFFWLKPIFFFFKIPISTLKSLLCLRARPIIFCLFLKKRIFLWFKIISLYLCSLQLRGHLPLDTDVFWRFASTTAAGGSTAVYSPVKFIVVTEKKIKKCWKKIEKTHFFPSSFAGTLSSAWSSWSTAARRRPSLRVPFPDSSSEFVPRTIFSFLSSIWTPKRMSPIFLLLQKTQKRKKSLEE